MKRLEELLVTALLIVIFIVFIVHEVGRQQRIAGLQAENNRDMAQLKRNVDRFSKDVQAFHDSIPETEHQIKQLASRF